MNPLRLLSALGATLLLTLSTARAAAEPNTLTPEEQTAGWKLLFDGKSLAGWVNVGKTTAPDKGWIIEDNSLIRKTAGGDIVSTDLFERFEIVWEWKMAKKGGNGGLKYNLPDPKKAIGFEYQMLGDEKRNPGNTHETACLYDMIAADPASIVHPPGEWNLSRIVFDGKKSEHWINNTKAVEFTLGSPELEALIAKSKFKSVAGFGKPSSSPILLQDHGSEVAIRSIKIRPLPASQ